jgi:hypothetical protein
VTERKRVVFLESSYGKESLFTRGLRTGAIAAGWEADVLFLADEIDRLKTEGEVRAEIETRRPGLICFLMDAPLHLERLWESASLKDVPKCSFWFDDYYRSPKTLARPEVWTRWQRLEKVQVAIWDGHWRKQWKALTGCDALATHLAADPALFDPPAAPLKPDWHDRAVFVGTLPSLKSLEDVGQQLPRCLQLLLAEFRVALTTAPWPLTPYDVARKVLGTMGGKAELTVHAVLKNPGIRALWNQLLWRWGKRAARLRGLAAVAQTGPLAVVSGHGLESYADGNELRQALPAGIDLAYLDTKGLPARSWQQLFRSGKFQVQITDPQSIEGGLPFRVFECAACGMPLLSDHRAELEQLFPPGNGLTTARDESELAPAAANLFAMPPHKLAEAGRRFHDLFVAGHSWEIRWRQMMELLRATTSEFGEPELDLPGTARAPLDAVATVGA